MPTQKSMHVQAAALQFEPPPPLRRCLTAAEETVSSVRWLNSKAERKGRRISINLTGSHTNTLQNITTERGEVRRKVLSFVQLTLGTRLSCHLLLTKASRYLNAHQDTCTAVSASTLGGKRSLGYFKTGPLLQLTDCSNFLQGRGEPLTTVLLLCSKHRFSAKTHHFQQGWTTLWKER